jgi:hypothetical protein
MCEASVRSFQSEIRLFRESIKKGPADDWRRLILRILDRWDHFAGFQDLWDELCAVSAHKGNPMPPTGVFIAWVIRTRLEMERLEQAERSGRDTIPKLNAQAERDWREGRWASAAFKKQAIEHVQREASELLGRKRDTATRMRFIKMWRDTFEHNCGRPLDHVVAALAAITFGADVSTDAVRATRKSRGIRRRK